MFQYVTNKQKSTQGKGRDGKVITIGGMIGAGKTTITNLLAEELGFKPFYENVEDNAILPLFYTSTPEEQQLKRYPFLLQLEFLNSRFSVIKEALRGSQDVIMDRSIYEDWYFARVNADLGSISEQEFMLYEKLLNNMMEELKELPKKSPDLMVYLKISFEKTLERIGKRGRDFEQDEGLYDYYHELWKNYDEWVTAHYAESDVLILDMDVIDVEAHPEQRQMIVDEVMKVYSRLDAPDKQTVFS